MLTEKKYFVLYNTRHTSLEDVQKWTAASKKVLASVLKGNTSVAKWQPESKAALCSASYYFWQDHVPDYWLNVPPDYFEMIKHEQWEKILGRSPEEYPQSGWDQTKLLQDAAPRIIAQSMKISHRDAQKKLKKINKDMQLAKVSCLLMEECPAYEALQDKVVEAVQGASIERKQDVLSLHETWPKDTIFEAWNSGENAKQIDAEKVAQLTAAFVLAAQEVVKSSYPELFKDLPNVFANISGDVNPAWSGHYKYSSPNHNNEAGFNFSLRCGGHAQSIYHIVNGSLHELDHIFQSHLSYCLNAGRIKKDHPLYKAALAFGTFDYDRDRKFGANTVPSSRMSYIANAVDCYYAAPRERSAHRLSNILNRTFCVGYEKG